MRTSEQQAALEAVKRMEPTLLLASQIAVLQYAVRALIQTSPNQEQLRTYFDQLLGQSQAYPGFIFSEDQSLVLRDLAKTMFQPPVTPDTLGQ